MTQFQLGVLHMSVCLYPSAGLHDDRKMIGPIETLELENVHFATLVVMIADLSLGVIFALGPKNLSTVPLWAIWIRSGTATESHL